MKWTKTQGIPLINLFYKQLISNPNHRIYTELQNYVPSEISTFDATPDVTHYATPDATLDATHDATTAGTTPGTSSKKMKFDNLQTYRYFYLYYYFILPNSIDCTHISVFNIELGQLPKCKINQICIVFFLN